MAKKKTVKKKISKKGEEGVASLADIQKELSKEVDILSLPLALQLVTGAAKDSAEAQRRGPEVWSPIWAERSPVRPYDDGTRFKLFQWGLSNGETALCVMAQMPLPIVVHTVVIGRGSNKRGNQFFRKEKVRCLGLKYGIDPETKVPKVLSTGKKCQFCALLGDRWTIIQVGGVIDLREQEEIPVDKRGTRYEQPPRMLLLTNDSSQRAIGDGLRERHLRGKDPLGTVFKVQRGMEQNAAAVGTNWVAQLDKEVSRDQIDAIYHPIDLDRAYPLLDGETDNVFEAKRHAEIITAIMQRHVSMYLKHEPGKGFDAHVAKELGLKLDTPGEDEDGDDGGSSSSDAPSERGLGLISLTDSVPSSSSVGPGLTDLGDKVDGEEESGESEEEGEKEEEAKEEEVEISIEDLEAELLDKEQTPLSDLLEACTLYEVESLRDKKGKVKRKATVAAIIKALSVEEEENGEEEEGEENEPWEE